MKTINDTDFNRLVRFIRDTYGINLEHKRPLIDARLSFDISRRGYSDFTGYVNKVISEPNGDETRHMVNKLSTNYTFFFRETDYIKQLSAAVIPDLISRGKKHIRVWSAACSSGQEAYSLAMVLETERLITNYGFDYEIIGTDINTDTLKAAVSGVYPAEEFGRIPLNYHHFTVRHSNGDFEIAESLKSKISWRYENLINPSLPCAETYAQYDIIFCRNVMIYFTPALRREMTVKLNGALLNKGYLFTGTTESIDLERKYFHYIAPAFYQKL